MRRGFQTGWTPASAQVKAEARRVRVVQEQKAEASAANSGIAQGGAGGASLGSRYQQYYDSLTP